METFFRVDRRSPAANVRGQGIVFSDAVHTDRFKGFRWKPICGDRVENFDSLNRSPCCAPAVNGHTASAPPSAASNSRRPMVTVMRPSRARCVKATIPRHEGAVFTLKEGWTAPLAAQPKDERLSPVSPLGSSVQGITKEKVQRNSSRLGLCCHLANRDLAKTVF